MPTPQLDLQDVPKGIPEPIKYSRNEHTAPYPGDRDIQFEMSPDMWGKCDEVTYCRNGGFHPRKTIRSSTDEKNLGNNTTGRNYCTSMC